MSSLSTSENPLPKRQNQWSNTESRLANQDKRLESIIISCLPNDVMKYVIKCKTAKETWNDLILAHEGPSDTRDTKIAALRLKFNAFKSLEDDEGSTKIRAFMEIEKDEPSVGKADARSGQWVDITMKNDYLKKSVWYLDSSYSRHMTRIKQYLHRYSKESGPKVGFKDDSLGDTKGKIENLNEVRIKELRSDNGTEFRNHKLEEFYDEKGVSQNFSSLCTPEQNGVAERRNKTLIEAAKTMLNSVKLPKQFRKRLSTLGRSPDINYFQWSLLLFIKSLLKSSHLCRSLSPPLSKNSCLANAKGGKWEKNNPETPKDTYVKGEQSVTKENTKTSMVTHKSEEKKSEGVLSVEDDSDDDELDKQPL
nr:putative ribonuclease H-like domain-containing protein [Tanacetum cinerariifolium]